MMKSLILSLVSVLCFAGFAQRFGAHAGTGNWPRPESLLAFYPFDGETQLRDIANNYHMSNSTPESCPQLMTDISGPFSKPSSSYTVVKKPFPFCYIGLRVEGDIPLPPKFTISFYFYTELKEEGGIVELYYQKPRFCVGYAEPNLLEIWAGEKGVLVGRFPSILQSFSWNFVAITYDKAAENLTIYDRDGKALATILTDSVPVIDKNAIIAGRAAPEFAYMRPTDAMACLMYYTTTLTGSEIAELPYVCMTKGQGTTRTTVKTTPTTTSTTVTTKPPIITPWPRPQSLLGFWPMNTQYKFQDVSQNHFDGTPFPVEDQLIVGPFGDGNTAFKAAQGGEKLFEVADSKLSIEGSFTVSLFFKRGGDTSGDLFEFLDKGGTQKAFQFRYLNSTTLEVGANSITLGFYEMIQQKGVFTSVAFVYEGTSATLTVYGRHGVVSPAVAKPQLKNAIQFNNNGIRLGYASRWKQGLQTSDAVTCLMVYSAALSASEVKQAHDACRIMHGSALCGSPRLPFTPVPPSKSDITVAKAGQFPYIALIRLVSMICSASIIDPYWLVTSAQCFTETQNPKVYKVYVGEHDYNVAETQTREHACSKVILSGTSPRDIALVQVTEPIDMTNEHVNDACLVNGDNAEELNLEATPFAFGWGKNGRPSYVSQTLPRYIPGQFVTTKQCLAAWGGETYNSTKDFCFTPVSNDKSVPCKGDEGSPFLVETRPDLLAGKSSRLVQIGTYYLRDDGCSANKHGLFANLGQFSNWIAEKIACAIPGVSYPDKCPQ